ncbi:MAG: type III pantothenate kinase [Oscillospiraceae bacterium]
MILTIDVGNSSISMSLFDKKGSIMFNSAIETELGRSRDRLAVDIKNIFQLYGFDISVVDGAAISSVVPPVTPNIESAVEFLIHKTPITIGPGVKTGLNILTEMHTQLGSDIVAAAVGAIKYYSPPLIIIDMGTATAVTAINAKGDLLGCSIMPGVRVSLEALWEHTAQLPRISIEPPKSVIGRNTIESMRSGIIFGTAAMLDGIIERMEAKIGHASVIATGGNVTGIIEYCKKDMIVDPSLVMRGLFEIYLRNK